MNILLMRVSPYGLVRGNEPHNGILECPHAEEMMNIGGRKKAQKTRVLERFWEGEKNLPIFARAVRIWIEMWFMSSFMDEW